MHTKECSRCHVVKHAEEFHKNNYSKTGLDSYCKSCRKHNTTVRKFNSIKKTSKGYNMDLIEAVSKELNVSIDKVKEVIMAQSVATKDFMKQGFIIKWIYVGKFCPRQARLRRDRINSRIKPPEKPNTDAETI